MSKLKDVNKKIEDKFVKKYLKKDGETIEEAKTRLKREEQARKEEHEKQMKELREKQERLVNGGK